jgi:hypothetical protein
MMGRDIKTILAEKISAIMIEYGFDDDEEVIDDIIECVLDEFGIAEDLERDRWGEIKEQN